MSARRLHGENQGAVALRYSEELPAPLVIASGRGRAAETITRIAREHGVTIVQDADLAESLIDLDIGSLIPEEHYQAVAAVLAVVVSRGGGGGSLRRSVAPRRGDTRP